MPLIFLLLLPLVLVPFLIERDARWFRRMAWLIAGVQAVWLVIQGMPAGTARMVSLLPNLHDSIQLLVKAVVHIY
jgi:hypothetical protein